VGGLETGDKINSRGCFHTACWTRGTDCLPGLADLPEAQPQRLDLARAVAHRSFQMHLPPVMRSAGFCSHWRPGMPRRTTRPGRCGTSAASATVHCYFSQATVPARPTGGRWSCLMRSESHQRSPLSSLPLFPNAGNLSECPVCSCSPTTSWSFFFFPFLSLFILPFKFTTLSSRSRPTDAPRRTLAAACRGSPLPTGRF
jgi:hypothetical protein